jgi:hypothetical protein
MRRLSRLLLRVLMRASSSGFRIEAGRSSAPASPPTWALIARRPCSASASSSRAAPSAVVDALARQQCAVAHLEFLDRVLGRHQALLDALDLFVDELHRLLRVSLLALETALDEDGQQRLHDVAHQFRISMVEGDGVDVVGRGFADFELRGQFGDLALLLARCGGAYVQVDHAHDALDVRARQQGAAHDGHLLLDVGQCGHAVEQGLEHALGIDEHPRRRLVVIRQGGHPEPAGDADQPHEPQRLPAIFPDASDAGQQLGDELLHVHLRSFSVSGGEAGGYRGFATH